MALLHGNKAALSKSLDLPEPQSLHLNLAHP